MVVAVFGGTPDWHPFQIRAQNAKDGIDIPDLDVSKVDAFGFLSLDGTETLFTLDGQHRLAGIMAALESGGDAGSELLD